MNATDTTVIVDDIPIRVRPIRADDKHHLVAGMELLSAQTRYLRFLNPVDHLTDEQLRLFTEPDGVNHVAYIALRFDGGTEAPVATARYIRQADDLYTAEFAITVADQFQRRGVGSLMLQTLAAAARRSGLTRLRGAVHPDNAAMLGTIRRFGGEAHFDGAEGVMAVELDPSTIAPPGTPQPPPPSVDSATTQTTTRC